MKPLFYFLYSIILTVAFVNTTEGAVCTATANGNWSNPAIWSCGAVPGCGDLILIPAGFTVNVDVQVKLDEGSMPPCNTPTHIMVSGTLQFITGNKLELACGSGVEIMPGGAMLPGGGGGSSNWLKICGIEQWKTSDGPVIGYKLFGSLIPLPTELIAYSVQTSAVGYRAEWTIGFESDNAYFLLEHSMDGKNWQTAVIVASVGDHNNEMDYSAEYLGIKNATLYIRLNAVNTSGISRILGEQSITIDQPDGIVSPNPVVHGEPFNLKCAGIGSIELTQVGGMTLQPQIIEATEGNYTISTSDLAPGAYFVRVGGVVQRMIVQ